MNSVVGLSQQIAENEDFDDDFWMNILSIGRAQHCIYREIHHGTENIGYGHRLPIFNAVL